MKIMHATQAKSATEQSANAVCDRFIAEVQRQVDEAVKCGEFTCDIGLIGKTHTGIPDYLVERCAGFLRENGYRVIVKPNGYSTIKLLWS